MLHNQPKNQLAKVDALISQNVRLMNWTAFRRELGQIMSGREVFALRSVPEPLC